MGEEKRLNSSDFSNVWKDGNNTLPSGLKLDLVKHLQQQRLSKEWVTAKERVIETMNFSKFDKSEEIRILDIGCGLGIDLMLVAQELTRLGQKATIVGLDQNLTMIEEAKKFVEQEKNSISPDISIEILHGDILKMIFNDESFDIVRSDITLQHVDLRKALEEIRRVLKVKGRLVALEGGAGDIYSSDETIIKIYDAVLPSNRSGGTAIALQFILPKIHFQINSLKPIGNIQTGEDLARADPDWVKLKGTGEMLTNRGFITKEQSEDFQKRYIDACRNNQILSAGIIFIVEAEKLSI